MWCPWHTRISADDTRDGLEHVTRRLVDSLGAAGPAEVHISYVKSTFKLLAHMRQHKARYLEALNLMGATFRPRP